MSNSPELHKICHNFGYHLDSDADFNDDTLKHNTFFYDETDPVKDSFAFAISARDKHRLLKDSTSNNVSLNTKVDQIIKDHLDWHAYAPDAKMVYMPKPWITRIVNQLTEQQRMAIVLRDLEDVPYERIARVLKCTEQAARLKVFRARGRLKELLEKALRRQERSARPSR